MSSDDLTHNKEKPDQDDKDTQPTITAVFRLLQGVESRQNARLDNAEARINGRLDETEARFNTRLDETEARFNARLDETDARLNARLDGVESRLAGDIDGVNTRMIEGFKELQNGQGLFIRQRLILKLPFAPCELARFLDSRIRHPFTLQKP